MLGAAALVLLVVGGTSCLVAACRGSALDRWAGLQSLTTLTVAVLLLLSFWFGRPDYVDVALVLAVVGFAGALVFTRFYGRSL